MSEFLAIALFVLALGLIASERIDRTKVALAGGGIAVLLGLVSQEEAIAAVDWGVIGLLAGMMILVWARSAPASSAISPSEPGDGRRGARPASCSG